MAKAKEATFPVDGRRTVTRGDVSVRVSEKTVYLIDKITYRDIAFDVRLEDEVLSEWSFSWLGSGDEIRDNIQLDHLEDFPKMPDPEYARLILFLDKMFRKIGQHGDDGRIDKEASHE